MNEEWTPRGQGTLWFNDSSIEINTNNIILIRKSDNFSDEKSNWKKMINWLSKQIKNDKPDDDMEFELSKQCNIKEIILPGIDKDDIDDISFLDKYGRVYVRKTTTGSGEKTEGVCELSEPFRLKPY